MVCFTSRIRRDYHHRGDLPFGPGRHQPAKDRALRSQGRVERDNGAQGMTAIPLPSFYSRDNLPRVLESTLAYDQWDDWIPDPIYFKDVSERADDFVTELAQQSEITLDGTYSLPVYSESTLKFHTAVVPLSARVLLNGLIASQGEVTRRVLNADRLSGFEYLPP